MFDRPFQDARCFISMSQSIQSPDAPKPPPGPFVKFMHEKYSEIQKNNPGANMHKISKIASQLWQELDPEERNAYKLHAQEEYQDYKQKYLVFLDGLSEQEKAQLHNDTRAQRAHRERFKEKQEFRNLGKPKKPPNAFMLFVRSSRLERGDTSMIQFNKRLADYWHNIPKEEKEIYEEDAKVRREQYFKELEEWEKKMIEMRREDVVRRKFLAKFKRTFVS
ncbi:transcription factor A, mitochondrial-like isoform X2 [Pomacea canaliculata]|uniref:transcription factor A, mitochondrial-like isoform X2 n=1 Tax=Pomacea canaliculata TaxID=400727 RepID=UPI000D72EBCF|nr:transcription factor A, mitochondrial-like isoform X2 [Pomacea canaliculata]